MAESTCMFENNICFQMFQATRIQCSRQRLVTPFLRCIRIWLRSSIVLPDCLRQRCPAFFICSRQISRDSLESGVPTASRVSSCSCLCETELPDSERARVSNAPHNLLDRFDSTVVLQYIRNESRRFPTFVANRIAMKKKEESFD